MRHLSSCLLAATLTGSLANPGILTGADSTVTNQMVHPLVRAHSHNDYEHQRPLNDALDRGFCSVEADIHLVNGELLVAHNRAQARPGRNLQSLYLDPLRERIRANGGRVYPRGPSMTLLVDVKSDAEATYRVLRDVLKSYSDILTSFRGGTVTTNAITVIISGNRAHGVIASETERFAALDGRLEDLDGRSAVSLIPLISDSWTARFKWRGTGPLSPGERSQLREWVDKAHAEGRTIRFWATPDTPEFWRELVAAGVDLISADDLEELQRFLLAEALSGNTPR